MRKFDHALLVKRHPVEVERLCAFLRRAIKGHNTIAELAFVHEADNSCCKAESFKLMLKEMLKRAVAPPEASPPGADLPA